MSREILFRAKRVNWRELPKEEWWVEGALFEGKENSYIFTNVKVTDKWENSEIGADVIGYLIDPEPVCEYTGLTDKDRKRFEGDIFQASDSEYMQRYIIAWDKYSLEWSAQCIGDPDGTLPFSEFRAGEIDVIGNIFDNLELLE